MKTPVTFYCYQVSITKRLEDVVSLFCLRIGLFFYSTSFRHFGPSMTIALLLFVAGASGEPVDVSRSQWHLAIALSSRLLSIVVGLIWLSIGLCRLTLQWFRAETWRQEMQANEEALRYRISVLEDWLVPLSKIGDEVVEVRYK